VNRSRDVRFLTSPLAMGREDNKESLRSTTMVVTLHPGDITSYLEMCAAEGLSLRRGMNYRPKGKFTVILMSRRPNAPYKDEVIEDGKVLIYEGHDVPRPLGNKLRKEVDQEARNPDGSLTQNGIFFNAAIEYKNDMRGPESVRVYEKLRPSIWVYNGLFSLVDAYTMESGGRKVFKFRLKLEQDDLHSFLDKPEVEQTRIIPSSVKLDVWKRDNGKCVMCGSAENLHFDHIIPYSKGGTSLDSSNIQILCMKHNLEKRDRIE
jgi:hypothetical protein